MNIRDVVPRKAFFEGAKTPLDYLLNRPLEVLNWCVRPSKLHNGSAYITMQIRVNGRLLVVITGAKCIIEDVLAFESIKGKSPFEATIIKLNKIYVFK